MLQPRCASLFEGHGADSIQRGVNHRRILRTLQCESTKQRPLFEDAQR